MRRIKCFLLGVCFIPLLLQAAPNLQSSYTTSHHSIHSKRLNRPFHLLVQTPTKISNNKKYPTIYLLDGGLSFPMLAGYYRYLRLEESIPEAIIVGIAYSGESFEQGNMRSVDYTAPSKERSYWGGAAQFHEVLRTEILPLIESNYPADERNRVLFGHSIGGQFVLFSAQAAPKLFLGYIASNPALHRNLDFFLKPYQLETRTLYVSSPANDDERFRTPQLKLMKHLQAADNKQIKAETVEGHGHFSVAPESFRQGLIWWDKTTRR